MGLGSATNARRFAEVLGFPLDVLYADPEGWCYKALGFEPGAGLVVLALLLRRCDQGLRPGGGGGGDGVRVLRQRLSEAAPAGDRRDTGVLVVAVGSSHSEANAATDTLAEALPTRSPWAGVRVPHATAPAPSGKPGHAAPPYTVAQL